VLRKVAFHLVSILPKSSFGEHKVAVIYAPPKRRFGKGRTNSSVSPFDALFKVLGTLFGPHIFEKMRRNESYMPYLVEAITKSGVDISRKCCFPHGLPSNLSIPNKELGRPNRAFRVRFQGKHFSTFYPNIVNTPLPKVLRHVANKTIALFNTTLLNEGTCIREYSTISQFDTFLSNHFSVHYNLA
jgi:hypothetical protein